MKLKTIVKIVLKNIFGIFKIHVLIGSYKNKPVGSMYGLLNDLKIRGFYPKLIFDVGAHKGDWSKLANLIFLDSTIYMFEPQIELGSFLTNILKKRNKLKFFQVGVGSKKEVRVFTIYDDLAGSSFLPLKDVDLLKSGKQRNLEIITINDFINDNNSEVPDLVKLDVQGFELEVLKGGSILFGVTEVFILEVSLYRFDLNMPTFIEIVNFMDLKGYFLYDFGGFLRRPLDGSLGQFDVCFVKRDGILHKTDNWG
jgi:FkbM family methyltransferase